ncbi:V-type ATP synthase subunit I [Oscillibacter sp.]|uniref:V-type ATP synthase subunit I n=1 Tax=Oscillibacter sp. TaxID=1945593 RepID=UPI00260A6785|nr:V-type ATP synthase subunit I [Oscillibacter sp.]MDD3347527.1 V-type ATP synthase subunit I [Oscillibacter sp.]
MAIVKMKKLRVIAMAARREELLKGLLHLGCVEISEPADEMADPAWAALLRRETSRLGETRSQMTDVFAALAAIKRCGAQKDGLFIQRRSVSETEFLEGAALEQAKEVSDRVGRALESLSRLQSEENRLLSRQAGLRPWSSLDMPLETEETAHAVIRMGVLPGGTDVGAIRTALSAEAAAAEFYEISADKQQRYCLLICHKAEEACVQELLRPYSFSVTAFQGVTGTAAENLQKLETQLSENRKEQEAAQAVIAESAQSRDALRLYADRLTAEAAKDAGTERLLTDGTILFFKGWVPLENLEKVSGFLEGLGCAWDASDPDEADYPEVPVKLKNNWLTRPLNMVTEMYSLPAYDNVDPNPLMAPFFILFYGIMMADMGYGLLMMLGSLFITRKYRPKGTAGHLFSLLGLCGVSTFIMGAITGGFFGDFLTQAVKLTTGGDFALPALFTPLNDTLMILIGAMCLGFVQILTGMVISFVQKVRKGQILDAVWEEVTWWVVFAGIALAVLGVTNLLLYVGIVMIVVGSGWNAKGFGKVTAIFGSLYNHVTGYFGDILSYSRLMALMLAGSVIAQVFNTLGAIPGNFFVFLIISMAGNALNFALNLLGCYVHDLRLQCLEYFGKFYQDGGKPFRPLAMDTKYVDING